MASSANHFSLFLLLTLLLHTHARDSQFFNKIPSTTNNVAVPTNTNKQAPVEQQQQQQQQQDPNFLPENENAAYGLYGHEFGQNPPSTTTDPSTTTTTPEFKQPAHKYLPKNYNPVAYVTQPEDFNDESTKFTEQRSFSTNPTNYYNGETKNYYNNQQEQESKSYYNNQQEQESEFRRSPTAANTRNNNDNYYYNGGSSFNSQPQSDARYSGGAAFSNSFQPQGMSDTRFLENGKYFYDINADKYSTNHPYESLKARNEYSNRNFYGNAEKNGYEFNGENAIGGYENQEEFQDEP